VVNIIKFTLTKKSYQIFLYQISFVFLYQIKKPNQKQIIMDYQKIKEMVLSFGSDVYKGVEYAKSKLPIYQSRPSKPRQPSNQTSETMLEYSRELESYEKQLIDWRKWNHNYGIVKCEIDTIIIDYIKRESGFYDIPEKYQQKVWDKAWSDGHGSGYSEVYHELCELNNIFS